MQKRMALLVPGCCKERAIPKDPGDITDKKGKVHILIELRPALLPLDCPHPLPVPLVRIVVTILWIRNPSKHHSLHIVEII